MATRVKAFTAIGTERVFFGELELGVFAGTEGRSRDVLIMQSLTQELRLHLDDRSFARASQSVASSRS